MNVIVWNGLNGPCIDLKEKCLLYARNVKVSTWTKNKTTEWQYTIDELTDCESKK